MKDLLSISGVEAEIYLARQSGMLRRCEESLACKRALPTRLNRC